MKIVSQKLFEDLEAMERVQLAVEPVTNDETDLITAFTQYFKPTCQEIGALIGVLDFRGGYENMMSLNQYILDQDINTPEGQKNILRAQTLAIKWQAANSLCNHEATKLGWKLPKWFVEMWSRYDRTDPEPQPEA